MPSRPAKERVGRGWKIAVVVLSVLLAFSILGSIFQAFLSVFSGPVAAAGETPLHEVLMENNPGSDKIAVIPVEGIIAAGFDGVGRSMVRLIEEQLEAAGRDERVKAVLLKVNSPGGEVLASDDIYQAIDEFQKEHDKPVIASMSSMAASGGYYVSAPCRWIVANELTITGSIGVIMHAYNYRGLMNKVGLRPMVFKSGKFKDMLSGDRDLENLSPEEKAHLAEESAMMQKMIDETYARFKTVVAEGRDGSNKSNAGNPGNALGRKLTARWADYADGRVLSGKEAFELGFVDELGNWRTAVRRAEILAGIQDADLVTYHQPFNLFDLFSPFAKAESKTVKVDLGLDVPRLQAGLYFLSPLLLH